MSALHPIYTPENLHIAYQLNWSVTLFWKQPVTSESWLAPLRGATEPDGVRILEHRFSAPGVSQFFVSTKPDVSPPAMLRSLKGRLQHFPGHKQGEAFKRNHDVHSVGEARREVVEKYLEGQVRHHPMADSRVMERLEKCQIKGEEKPASEPDGGSLSEPRFSAHGRFRYNLHIVLVNDGRYCEISEEALRRTREGIPRISRERGYLLSRAGILPDHLHLLMGCPWESPPLDIAMCFLNNLAWLHGMRPIFFGGAYIGTVGDYNRNALRRGRQADADP